MRSNFQPPILTAAHVRTIHTKEHHHKYHLGASALHKDLYATIFLIRAIIGLTFTAPSSKKRMVPFSLSQ